MKINKKLFPQILGDYFLDRSEQELDSAKVNWERYDPYHIIAGMQFRIKDNKETYLQKELRTSEHPFLKEVCKLYDQFGSTPFIVYMGKMITNSHHCLDDFESNEEIRMFITFYFWRYLCYCANIDFEAGEDKTEGLSKRNREITLNIQ